MRGERGLGGSPGGSLGWLPGGSLGEAPGGSPGESPGGSPGGVARRDRQGGSQWGCIQFKIYEI